MIAGSLFLAVTVAAAEPLDSLDLATIGPVAPKGRIQDLVRNSVAERLIAAGPAAIQVLVSKLEDERLVEEHVFDFWPEVRVGDIALVLLCDLFLARDGISATVPGLAWDTLLQRRVQDVPASTLLYEFIAKHGRGEIRRRVLEELNAYPEGFSWDSQERCLKPKKTGRRRTTGCS